jgi:hypothetical protein
MAWAVKVYGEDGRYLTASFQVANYLLSPRMGDDNQLDYERIVRLPVKTNWPSTKVSWLLAGYDLPTLIQPTLAIREQEIICSLISKLRTGLALDLDPNPIFDRKASVIDGKVASGQSSAKTEYLVIGRTGAAAMMAAALARAGKKVEIISPQDWRLTASYVGRIVEEAMAAITTMRPSVVILIGLHESYLMARYEEVYTLPATKGPDGCFHIHGELVVANKEAQSKLLAMMDPIWEATIQCLILF